MAASGTWTPRWASGARTESDRKTEKHPGFERFLTCNGHMFIMPQKSGSMPRPHCRRFVSGSPAASVFKPAGIPRSALDEIVLALDEFEALRLADLEQLYQEAAAVRMGISRPTLSRILDSARRKVADALVHGKALRIEGGPVQPNLGRRRCCRFHDRPEQPRGAAAPDTDGDPFIDPSKESST